MPSAGPSVFRVLLEARSLSDARSFYEELLGIPGRLVAEGRVYFDCGTVILGVLATEGPGSELQAPKEAIYFATQDLEEVHRRAARLGCLSRELLHFDSESPMGEIRVRPWGERSFYASDPSGNPLCFVDARTLFTGTPAQVEDLRRLMGRDPNGATEP